ncbi:MAG: NAD(P)/FAD-dependent oxidoreductase [Candidatus Bathyarchaeota archaeon]|nr:MAG: NAD(P)/FAD-dependent oxidoreductase [Candidatus Bathyarchaeota archaeon]
MKADLIIIGGGIVGTTIARELSKYKLQVLLVEKEADIGFGSTKANTGIIHAGYDDIPGTIKANLCVRGNTLWPQIAAELGIPFIRTGSWVVACKDEEANTILKLKRRGIMNNVPGLQIIDDRKQLLMLEPNISNKVLLALYAPTAGIISPYEAAIALAENAYHNGVQIQLETEVKDILLEKNAIVGIRTNRGLIETNSVINAAGIYSDEISAMCGINHFSITPVRGEYFVLDKNLNGYVRHILFPVPTPVSKGIVVSKTVAGNLIIGPNANNVNEKTDLATTKPGLNEVFEGAQKLVPGLASKRGMVITIFAGLRAESSIGDFIIEAYDSPRGFINVAGIKSPGLTAAPAIAEKVIQLLKNMDSDLNEKKNYNPSRESIQRTIDSLSTNQSWTNMPKDPNYGHMICRCEHVSEGEIVEAIQRGANTFDGIKFRTRAGMGRCQGGFCTPHLIRILSRELDLKAKSITKHGRFSSIVPYEVKESLMEER